MRPKTNVRFDAKSFADLKRTLQLRSETRRHLSEDPGYATPLPLEVSLQLTYKCNLRCTHCYQWNEQGFFRGYDTARQRTELELDVVEKVLRETAEVRAKVFLWGGEPLLHSRFAEVSRLLQRYPRTINMCTNGLLLERNLEHLLPLGAHLNLLLSLDGLKEQHEALRGRGTFDRTVHNLQVMLELKRQGRFEGELSLSCMVSNETVGQLHDIAVWAESLGVNSVYFQLPWYIGEPVADAMDALYATHFSWLNPVPAPGTATWRSYTYRIQPERLPLLREDMARIASRAWDMRIRFQPEVSQDELQDFVHGTSRPAQGRTQCLAVSNRMEVHADGNVSSCKFFPEFIVGNLHDTGVRELWQGERFRKVREQLHHTGLMPVCSKCILLYLNGL
jgi:radical SAM protein with 4Fe4S-binding SPASM domain